MKGGIAPRIARWSHPMRTQRNAPLHQVFGNIIRHFEWLFVRHVHAGKQARHITSAITLQISPLRGNDIPRSTILRSGRAADELPERLVLDSDRLHVFPVSAFYGLHRFPVLVALRFLPTIQRRHGCLMLRHGCLMSAVQRLHGLSMLRHVFPVPGVSLLCGLAHDLESIPNQTALRGADDRATHTAACCAARAASCRARLAVSYSVIRFSPVISREDSKPSQFHPGREESQRSSAADFRPFNSRKSHSRMETQRTCPVRRGTV